jgi:hypothetical protein
MKKRAEIIVEHSLKHVTSVIERYRKDISDVLEAYEVSHDESEVFYSKQYQALVAANYHLGKALESIDKQLNK